MATAFDRAERDRIDHQPRFEAGLDREKAAEFLNHAHSLRRQRSNGRFEPIPS
jgi:hypothetical protein